jgi:hypothetical protein
VCCKTRCSGRPGSSIDDDDRRELIDDPADQPMRDVLALLGEVMALVFPTASAALVEAGIPDATRVAASSEAASTALYPEIARAFGGPPTLLYTTPRATSDLTLLAASPPVVIIGPGLASLRAASRGDRHIETDAALRFQLGRIIELSRPYRVFAALPEENFAQIIAGLREGGRLRARLPVALRQRLTERLASLAPDALDPRAYIAACERAADRAGMLACGDIAVAVELAGGARVASHLVRLAGSRRYLAVRRKLRAR